MFYMVLNLIIFAFCAYTSLKHKRKGYKGMVWLAAVGISVQLWVITYEMAK